MNLTPQQREQIYYEEKAAREASSERGASPLLFLLTLGAVAGLAALLTATLKRDRQVSLDDLRKAYSGLSEEDEPEEKPVQ